MASVSFRDSGDVGYGASAPEPGSETTRAALPGLFNIAGAVVSAVLIVGLGVWGYRLAVRDVTGVPVIRALAGPARVAPADPGGDLARHVGLSVNAVAAQGVAQPLPDHVVLAPRPLELDSADMPMAELAPLPQVDFAETAVTHEPTTAGAAPLPDLAASALPALPPDAGEQPSAVILALAEAMAYDATLAPLAHPAAAPVAEARPGVIAQTVPGVTSSPRPLQRPSGGQILAATPSIDLAAETLPAGTRLVQLGAYDDVETARAEWDKVSARFEALMAGKKRVIHEAESGGQVFFRLRVAGFEDAAEARQFCAALQAEQANCIPAQVF
jgi:hypothetical protein